MYKLLIKNKQGVNSIHTHIHTHRHTYKAVIEEVSGFKSI